MNHFRLLAQESRPADLTQALRGALAAGVTPAEIEIAIRGGGKLRTAETNHRKESPMQDLFWEHTTSLAAWACAVATSVVERLDIGDERDGYRHVVNTTIDGVVTHELVEIASGLTVYICYRRPSGEPFSGFCQPWPPVLVRFVEAFLLGGLLGECA